VGILVAGEWLSTVRIPCLLSDPTLYRAYSFKGSTRKRGVVFLCASFEGIRTCPLISVILCVTAEGEYPRSLIIFAPILMYA